MLVDGRNRREGCRRAGIRPNVTNFNGTDPVGYIIGANVHRRHLSKGQIAMAVAKIYPKPRQVQAGDSLVSKEAGLSETRVSQARTVLAFAPDFVDGVLANAKKLDAAYAEARRGHRRGGVLYGGAGGLREILEAAPS